MSRPAQMFDHELNPVKGWPSPYAVDKAAEPAEGVSWNGGMVMHLNATSGLELGAMGTQMPIFMLQNSSDPDVHKDYGSITGGVGSGLVGGFCYEVESTEYVDTEDYHPNDLLKSDTEGADAGKLRRAVCNVDTIVGVVSDGTYQNDHGKMVLKFWTWYIPDCSVTQSSSST